MRVAAENRFWVAIAIYAALALLAWRTLTATVDVNGRAVPLAWIVYLVLLMFALRTWVHEKRIAMEQRSQAAQDESIRKPM